MLNKNIKLSLSILENNIDGAVVWNVEPDTHVRRHDSANVIVEFDYDPRTRKQIKIHLIENLGQQSFLQICQVSLSGVKLDNLPCWSRYIAKDTNKLLPNTHGFMTVPGTYILNIHSNALSHNYISYFLSCSSKQASVDQKIH